MNTESSADVQREAEAERADLVRTLDQLRENLKPANVVDEVMATAKVSTADISDRVWQTARDNPIPAAFIALGAAMLSGFGKRSKPADESAVSAATGESRLDGSRGGQPRGSFRWDAESRAAPVRASGDRMPAALQDVGDRADRSAWRIARTARSLRREASRATADATPSAIQDRARLPRTSAMSYSFRSRGDLSQSLSRLIEDQPLILAAVGVAIGAAIGAAIPGTEAEGRLMGDASGSLKSRAQDIAQSEMAHLKATASDTLDQLKQTAADHGLSSDNLSGLVQDTGAKLRNAAQDATDHAANTAGLKS